MILRVLLNGAYTSGEKLAIILPQIAAVSVIIFLILPLHEWAHGFVAHKLGDDTAKREGRLTFNPIASIDPIGALFILLFGFGWAKPVPINPNNFKHAKIRHGADCLGRSGIQLGCRLGGRICVCGCLCADKGRCAVVGLLLLPVLYFHQRVLGSVQLAAPATVGWL